MERKEIVVENPVTVPGLTLIPVVQVLRNYWHANNSASFFAVKQPVAVIVVSPSEKRAFRITGEEVSIDQLIQEAPSIKRILERP